MDHPWLTLGFAARHDFAENALRHLGKPLFGSVRTLELGLLGPEDAQDLLHRPHPDFRVLFVPEASERILELCGGQPYLLQLFGWHLVRRLNRLRRQDPSRQDDMEPADVDSVLDQPDFWEEAAHYFGGVLDEIGEEARSRLLSWLAEPPSTQATHPATDQDLETLVKHAVLERTEKGTLQLRVPLLELWLRREGHPSRVVPAGKEMTTQQAADMLNVSRQYLVRLLEEGRIPCTKTGQHRRLNSEDVLAFKEQRDRERGASLDELARMSQETDGYDELK